MQAQYMKDSIVHYCTKLFKSLIDINTALDG